MNRPSPAIIGHIQGGLGNQLFCYAAARALALRAGLPLRVNTRSGYGNEKFGRACMLDAFLIDASEAGVWEGFRGPLGRSRRSLTRQRSSKQPLNQRTLIQEPKDQAFMPELLELMPKHTTYLLGHWQDARYFDSAADTIRQELQPHTEPTLKPEPWVEERVRQENTVSVHCRSYREVPNPQAGLVLDATYYTKAFETVLDRLPDARFLVFSDAPDWAARLIGQTGYADRTDLVPKAEGDATTATLVDFGLMRRCLHHIVANSSFSWWTAWLGEREGSIIAAPESGLPGNGRFPARWVHVG